MLPRLQQNYITFMARRSIDSRAEDTPSDTLKAMASMLPPAESISPNPAVVVAAPSLSAALAPAAADSPAVAPTLPAARIKNACEGVIHQRDFVGSQQEQAVR